MRKIGVVGLGKLGLPLALVMSRNTDNEVVGFDVDPNRVKQLQDRNYNGPEPLVAELLNTNHSNLKFTECVADLADSEIAYLIVPTPSAADGSFINDYLLSALEELSKVWRNTTEPKVVVIVSTVMPGSTEGELRICLEKAMNKTCGEDLALVYSPEFIALGSVVDNLLNPDVILIGSDCNWAQKKHLAVTTSYLANIPNVISLNFKEAELSKILLNTYITMKISFANFIGELARFDEGINAISIAEAVSADSRVGSKYFRPGLGYGGPCFPRDNRALISYSTKLGTSADLALATDNINLRTPITIAENILARFPKLRSVGVYGLTYKENSEVTEESQSIMLANVLAQHGVQVKTFDPILVDRPKGLSLEVGFVENLEDFVVVDLVINATGEIHKDFKLLDDTLTITL